MKTQNSNLYSLDTVRENKNICLKKSDLKSYFEILSMSELLGENQKIIAEIQTSFRFDGQLKLKSNLILNEFKNRLSGSPSLLQQKFHKLSKQHESLINKF